ncbi:MAG: hypothetical protein LQ340_000626 [Diploschistes diacapsis]|nr:MAG: hypothetical protein LQ340_000626 [Diploschistes diacapsis]
MLLDEDPAELMHQTIANFNLAPDKAAVARINEALGDIHTTRDLRIREAESALKKLSRTHNLLSSHHTETLASHSSATHASHIVELDTQKFRIAKAASDLEIESDRLEAELDGLKSRLQELDLQGVEGDDTARQKREGEDETVLKLKVYRTLGIDIELEEGGKVGKAVVRNARRGDVHVVHVDPKFSRFYYANYFWGTI